MIRLAIIGCGAVVEQYHMPALRAVSGMQAVCCVDPNSESANRLAQAYGIKQVVADYRNVDLSSIDAVLIATPHFLHAEMCEYFLARDRHVFCEKPFVTDYADGKRVVSVAGERKMTLAVGVFRRFYPMSVFIKHALATGWLGSIKHVDVEEGGQYGWLLQSPFMMDRKKAGGGVLADTGAHTLDRLLWWFDNPEYELKSYADNSASGVESDCEMQAVFKYGGADIPVRMELSRTRELRNSTLITMSEGVIEVPANKPDGASIIDYRLRSGSAEAPRVYISSTDSPDNLKAESFFVTQLQAFRDAVTLGTPLVNDGESALRFLQLMDDCYAARVDLPEPWVKFQTERSILEVK